MGYLAPLPLFSPIFSPCTCTYTGAYTETTHLHTAFLYDLLLILFYHISMAYTDKIREECFKLFCQDVPIEEIARQTRPSKVTLWGWVEKHGWIEERAKIRRDAAKKVYGDLTEIKVGQYNRIKTILEKYDEQLATGKVIVSTSDAIKLFEHQLLIAGEAATIPKLTFEFKFQGQGEKKKGGKKKK